MSTPGGIRTPNPRFRRPMLYPVELRALSKPATRVCPVWLLQVSRNHLDMLWPMTVSGNCTHKHRRRKPAASTDPKSVDATTCRLIGGNALVEIVAAIALCANSIVRRLAAKCAGSCAVYPAEKGGEVLA